jgi:chromosomal replication initiation ATPase DnaA
MTQIPLGFEHEISYSFDDYIRAPSNAAALDFLLSWPDWPARQALIVGPEASGKTHLAHIWADMSKAEFLSLSGRALKSRVKSSCLIIDNIDQSGPDGRYLFHALNEAKAIDAYVLMTSCVPPEDIGFLQADALSRLRASTRLTLGSPDEPLLAGQCAKLLADRQLDIAPPVLSYVLQRIERTHIAVKTFVDMLDRITLSERKSITRQVAMQALNASRSDAGLPLFDDRP